MSSFLKGGKDIMKKAMSLLTATAMAATLLAGCGCCFAKKLKRL